MKTIKLYRDENLEPRTRYEPDPEENVMWVRMTWGKAHDQYIDIAFDEQGGITVRGGGAISVHPEASNSIRVTNAR